jgi:dipeptidyl aminopeptidase/acylaminoacyl peptidase
MRLGWLWFAGLLAAGVPSWAQGAALEAYGQLPSLDAFTISPDGKNIAYVTNVEGKRTVLINSLEAGKPVAGITVGDQKLRDLTWADNDNLLLTMSVTHAPLGAMGPRQEFFLAQTYRLSDHKSVALLAHGTNAMNIITSLPEVRRVHGKAQVFLSGITFNAGQSVRTLFAVDMATGESGPIEYGTRITRGWVIDGDGALVARTLYDEDHQTWGLQISNGPGWATVATADAPIETPEIQGIGADGRSLFIAVPQDNGGFVAKVLSMPGGKWSDAPDTVDPSASAVFDPATHRVIGMAGIGTNTQYVFFDKADQDAWNGLARAFPDENVELVSWSDDRKQVVVRVDGRRDGASFFLVDLNTHKAAFLGPVYQGIEPAEMAEVKFITYAAADGTQIPAYLTLPNGKAAKNLPLIVVPHGGPAARDTPQFDWLSQALASRGYAVLQPEFRGSDGFGWKHLAAGFGEWGRKMQTDLSDGVRYLAGQGTIDPKRVCIVGGSYGGYAALAGATLDKGVYRCAVSDSGVSDPHDMLAWIADREGHADSQVLRFWDRFMGVTDPNDAKLAEISPLRHAADVSIPLLLIHGKDDTVVPIEQSTAMAAAMQAAGKPVTFVKLDREDHWLSSADTRLRMLQETVRFLEANNPPG